jgi:hypothetical protein
MPVTIEHLGPAHVAALRSLLSRDASNNLYLLGLMEEFGVVCDPDRAPFAYYGRFEEGELTATVFVGGNGGLVVPSANQVAHIADIARRLRGHVHPRACVGERPIVDALLQHLRATPRVAKAQRLFGVSADDLGPFTNPLLRQAVERDVDQLVPMAASCVREVMDRDPLIEDPEGFPVRVRQRVKSGRTYVLEHEGRLIFKLDVGSRSQFGAELEGLYTVPRGAQLRACDPVPGADFALSAVLAAPPRAAHRRRGEPLRRCGAQGRLRARPRSTPRPGVTAGAGRARERYAQYS